MPRLLLALSLLVPAAGCPTERDDGGPTNDRPEAAITSPADGFEGTTGEAILLQGEVSDRFSAGGELWVTWSSSVGGVLFEGAPDEDGTTAVAGVELAEGDHTITLRVVDPQGASGVDSVDIVMKAYVPPNEPPSTPVVSIAPASPDTSSDLTLSIDTPSVDPDDGPEPLSYRIAWSVAGEARPDLVGEEVVPSTDTDGGDVWQVEVTATDGEADSKPATATVTVGNTAPGAPVVSITPAAPRSGDDLVCTIDVESTDPDGDTVTYGYAWTVDQAPAAIVEATVPASATRSEETWACTATPHDGTGPGESASASVTLAECMGTSVTSLTPVSYWRLDEVGGAVAADSVGTAPGAVVGAPFGGAPIAGDGSSAQLDGVSEWIDAPASSPSSFTVLLWFNFDVATGAYQSPATSRGVVGPCTALRGWFVYVTPSAALTFNAGDGDCDPQTPGWPYYTEGPVLTAGTDYFVAGAIDSGAELMSLYLDGALVASAAAPDYTPAIGAPLRIGAGTTEQSVTLYHFGGRIDEVAWFDRALTAAEVADVYASCP